jgi:hypothetical protein
MQQGPMQQRHAEVGYLEAVAEPEQNSFGGYRANLGWVDRNTLMPTSGKQLMRKRRTGFPKADGTILLHRTRRILIP